MALLIPNRGVKQDLQICCAKEKEGGRGWRKGWEGMEGWRRVWRDAKGGNEEDNVGKGIERRKCVSGKEREKVGKSGRESE